MSRFTHESEDHSARVALIAMVVIAILLGLLFWSSERVSERRAEMAAHSRVAPQGAAAEEPGLLAKLVAGVKARRNAQLESGRNRQLQLATLGVLLIIGSQLWCAIAAFGISPGWGLLVLVSPGIGVLAFSLFHWEEARPAAIGCALGAAIALTSNLL